MITELLHGISNTDYGAYAWKHNFLMPVVTVRKQPKRKGVRKSYNRMTTILTSKDQMEIFDEALKRILNY